MATVLVSTLKKLFDEAARKILDEKWTKLLKARFWQDVLSFPDLSDLPTVPLSDSVLRVAGLKTTEAELLLQWAVWATEFVSTNKEQIHWNLREIGRHLEDELAIWNHHHHKKNEQLPFEQVYLQWHTTVESYSLRDFNALYISVETARQFLNPKYDEIEKRYRIGTNKTATTAFQREALDSKQEKYSTTTRKKVSALNYPVLSLRQIALLYIYQDKVIGRGEEAQEIAQSYNHRSGERLYKLYTRFSRPSDRTGIEGKQIKPFIDDLVVVIPYLDYQQQQQAETEKKLISAKIQD